MTQKDMAQLTKIIYTADKPIQQNMKAQIVGQGKNKFNVKEKANNRANLIYRTDYSCSKCNIQYSTHNDRVYHNRLEHMKTNCIKCNLDIHGEKNKQTHEKKCTKTKKNRKDY